MDIRCRKTTCKYNKGHTCMAKEIGISKDVICSTYQLGQKLEEKGKTEDASKYIFEKIPDESPHRDRKTIKLMCRADCLFNEKGCCKANGILVNDLGEPFCMGFLKK